MERRGSPEFREKPEAFDALITDLSMPAMSGLQFARELLGLRAGLRIILTSGYFTPEDQVNANKLGVPAMLTKPVNPKEMLNAWSYGRGCPRQQEGKVWIFL